MRSAPGRARRDEILTTAALACTAGLGLLAQLALAAWIGPGTRLDLFFRVTAVPLAFVGIGVTAFSASVIPRLAAMREAGTGPSPRSELLAGGLLLALAIALGGGLLTIALAAFVNTEADPIPTSLVLLAWTACVGGLAAQLLGAFHNAEGRFVLPAASGAIFPVALILAAVLGRASAPASLAAAYAAAGLGQAAVLALFVRRGLFTAGSFGKGRERAGELAAAALLPVAATLLSTMFAVSDAFWAARLPPAGLSHLNLAVRITVPIAAIVTTGVATVSFPRIAALSAARRGEDVRREVGLLLVRGLAMLGPLAAVGVALREPAIRLLLGRGAFLATDEQALVALLPAYLLGMVAVGVSNALVRTFFATGRSTLAAAIGITATLAYFALSGLLVRGGAAAIAWVYAGIWTATALVQVGALGRHLGGIVGRDGSIALLRALGATTAAGVVAGAAWRLLGAPAPGRPALPSLVVAGGLGLIAAFVVGPRRQVAVEPPVQVAPGPPGLP